MCEIVEYCEDRFKIKYGDYQSDSYSDLNELRLYDISIICQDSKYKSIPFDIYSYKNFRTTTAKKLLISRKSIDFKIDKHSYNTGEFWIIRHNDCVILKWAVFDYQINFMFIEDVIKCSITDAIGAINNVMWKDFAYDNFVIQWFIDNLNNYCRKNIDLSVLGLNSEITSIIWDYIICAFNKID
jgi:hypothetical protein